MNKSLFIEFAPGDWVVHPTQKDWGIGQVQSVVGTRITVNFEHQGKVLIEAQQISLEAAKPSA